MYFVPLVTGVIFEDDFNSFTSGWSPSVPGGGHQIAGGTLSNPGRNEPAGWTGYIHYDASQILDITTTCGLGNSPCLRIGPKMGAAQWGQIGLVKFLGDNGYDELYVRYYIKLSDGFQFGDGTNGSWSYWKHGRIWQNLSASDIVNNNSLPSELGRGAVVWGLYDDAYTDFNPYLQGFFLKNTTEGTNGCVDCGKMYYYSWNSGQDGGFYTPHIGSLDSSGVVPIGQNWHSLEFHFKLADSWNGPNGLFETWIDGIKQVSTTRNVNVTYGMPTAKLGSGMNYITLHDNGNLSKYWTSQHYIYIDDVVISTSYIGP